MGIPLMRTKTWAYAIGAFFGGVAGAYVASFNSGAFPSQFHFNISIFLLCMVILGGMGSLWGVVVGGSILAWLNVEGLANIGSWVNAHTPLNVEVAKYQFGIYGIIIVLMMLFRPVGPHPGAAAQARARRRSPERRSGTERSTRSSKPRSGEKLDDGPARPPYGGEHPERVRWAARGLASSTSRFPRALDRQPDRAERRRQDDLLQHADGRVQADAGEIVFDGTTLTGKPPHAITKLGIGRTFQNIRLFPRDDRARQRPRRACTARLKRRDPRRHLRHAAVRREEREAHEKALELLRYFGLAPRRRRARREPLLRRPAPAGDRPRACDRAEAAPARRADGRHEPAGDGGASPSSSARCATERPITILLIEHDMKVVMGICERMAVLDYGEKIAEGTPAEIQQRPERSSRPTSARRRRRVTSRRSTACLLRVEDVTRTTARSRR